ncbi:MAG: hypothetical protein WBB67_08040 [bacterium]
MKLINDERGQLHTIEGLAAAVLMIATIFFVTQGVMVITPQTELSLDVQLKQLGSDALTVLDADDPLDGILLKKYVAAWNGTEANITHPVPNSTDVNSHQFGSDGMNDLNHSLYLLLNQTQRDVLYNVDFVYQNGSSSSSNNDLNTSHVIMKGFPPDNSIAVSRLVTLHRGDNIVSPQLNTVEDLDLKVVEVRLILWWV